MPYVVTTKRLAPPVLARREKGWLVVSRRAVATLEDAQEAAHVAAQGGASTAFASLVPGRIVLAIERLPEWGGTVGPLPDGTVIQVELVAWQTLIAQADFVTVPSPVDSASNATEIIAAFNATQDVEA